MAQKGSGVKIGLSYNTGIYGADPGQMAALAKHAEGEFFAFKNTCSFPKPHHGQTLPIHVGGSSNAAAIRAGPGAGAAVTFPEAGSPPSSAPAR
jgi:alkanesulfonate monooxygenase SsuD/methylene tetrahydromethanopterin reductase-like flavin-dependent oxidoreductase (luciferase family)